MIPKGLLIAIILGVSSALVLGVYLQKTYNSNALKFVEGTSISILTDKSDYTINDIVVIDVINTGTVTVSFSNLEPSIRVRALDGTEFYSTFSEGTQLAPKEKITISWNQLKNDNTRILEGRYVIESFAYDKDQKIHDSTTINVFK